MAETRSRQSSNKLSTLLSVALVLGVGFATWYVLDSRAGDSQAAEQHADALTMAAETPDAREAAHQGQRTFRAGLPTRVVVPSAGIDAPIEGVGVVEQGGQAAWETSWTAVGHHIDSALPGSPGNLVLTGHVSVSNPQHSAYFATLDRVQPGDVVEVHSGEAVFRYEIEELRVVPPDATEVLRADHRSRVTLITCTPDLEDRLVVVGRLVT